MLLLSSCGSGLCGLNGCEYQEPYGILDLGFGTNGTTIGPLLSSNYTIADMQLDLQTNLFFAGRNSTGNKYLLGNTAMSLNPTTSFGTIGILTGNWPGGNDRALKIAIQADKKIIVCGNSGTAPADSAVMRVNTDGSIDTSFGTAGTTVVDYFANSNECIDVAVQLDGKIVSIGRGLNGASSYDYTVTRYLTDGSLDTGFATAGKYSIDYATATDSPLALYLESNGNIIVSGTSFSGVLTLKSIRLDSTGALDTSFGTSGTFTYSPAGLTTASIKKILKDGTGYYFISTLSVGGSQTANIFKSNLSGSLDTSFGTNGTLSFSIPGYTFSSFSDAFFQRDGKLITSGAVNNPYVAFVARFSVFGQIDSNFGLLGTGYRLFDLSSYTLGGPLRMLSLSSGKFYLFGLLFNGTNYITYIQRYR